MPLRYCLLTLAFLVSLPLYAQELKVSDPWIRSAPPGVPLAGYMMLHNTSSGAVQLVGAEVNGFGHTMIHFTSMVEGAMTMEHLHSVEVPAGGNAAFQPGGLHLMLSPGHDRVVDAFASDLAASVRDQGSASGAEHTYGGVAAGD